ncbi:MAG: hypothetical protein HPY44_15745 [Armatimonadetes bacterium]|nr:hypothetical protein [Armatimonadota bacterium]
MAGGRKVDFAGLGPRVESVLRASFPTDTIDVSEGYMGRAHVKIVSKQFNGLSEREKQEMVWKLLRDGLGTDAQDVAFVLAFGTDELP